MNYRFPVLAVNFGTRPKAFGDIKELNNELLGSERLLVSSIISPRAHSVHISHSGIVHCH